MFILFDEQKVVMEFARRGLNKCLPLGNSGQACDRLPMVGWECTNCGKILRMEKAVDGDCTNCFSPEMNPVFGEMSFLNKSLDRKKKMKEIAELQTRK